MADCTRSALNAERPVRECNNPVQAMSLSVLRLILIFQAALPALSRTCPPGIQGIKAGKGTSLQNGRPNEKWQPPFTINYFGDSNL